MIHIISLFTLLTILLGSSMTIMSVKKNLNKNLKECVSTTTDFNIKRRTSLKRLFSLNSKAKMLRTQRKTTELVYMASPPQTKAAAYAALQYVKMAQKAFRAVQQTIIYSLKIQIVSLRFQVLSKKYSVTTLSQKSLVDSYPRNSDSPSYKPASDFSSSSKVLIRKSFTLNKNFPAYFKSLLNSKKGLIECGSNMIIKNNKEIQLKLLGGRSF
jgi:hypothetical protein